MAESSTPEHAQEPSRKRSRVVAALSDEQIRHKRTIDRKAQRAFRQRNKDNLKSLEQQFTQLQETCRGLEAELTSAKQHNATLVQCIESMQDLIRGSLEKVTTNSHREGTLNDVQLAPTIVNTDCGDRSSEDQNIDQINAPARLPSSSPQQSPAVLSHTNDHGTLPNPRSISPQNEAFSGRIPPETLPSYEPASTEVVPARPNDEIPAQSSPNSLLAPPSETHGISQSPATCVSSYTPNVSVSSDRSVHYGFPSPCSAVTASADHWGYSGPSAAYTAVPVYSAPTCPLDQILLDFFQKRRRFPLDGTNVETAVGLEKLSVKALINKDEVDKVDPLSGIMSRVLTTFAHVGLTEKLAFFYLMTHTMRWMINPTQETYSAMPTWLRPTVTQITTPHAIWIDNIPWPGVRDILIENPIEYSFNVFSEYYSQSVTVNWQYDAMEAVTNIANDSVVHSIFEKHIRKLANWTVTPEFLSRFPTMAAVILPQS